MASDFLNDVAHDAAMAMKSTDSSPYSLKKEGSKTAQIRTRRDWKNHGKYEK